MLLISDANILIDIEVGELVESMFSLDYQFVVPDVLFYEELEEHHSHLLNMGLKIKNFDEHMVMRVSNLARQYKSPSRNDLFALSLAQIERCPLLTGDNHLRIAAEKEKIEVRGTLWLMNEMVKKNKIDTQIARGAYKKMETNGRRLPWNLAEEMLTNLEIELSSC